MTSAQAFRAPEHVHWKRFDSELVVLDLAAGQYYGLSDVAADAFDHLAGGQTLEETTRALLDAYDVSSGQLADDVLRLAADLVSRGLLVASERHEGVPPATC